MHRYPIEIIAGKHKFSAHLNDSETAVAIWDALPITGQVQTWGDEIYFAIPVTAEPSDDAQETVPQGSNRILATW